MQRELEAELVVRLVEIEQYKVGGAARRGIDVVGQAEGAAQRLGQVLQGQSRQIQFGSECVVRGDQHEVRVTDRALEPVHEPQQVRDAAIDGRQLGVEERKTVVDVDQHRLQLVQRVFEMGVAQVLECGQIADAAQIQAGGRGGEPGEVNRHQVRLAVEQAEAVAEAKVVEAVLDGDAEIELAEQALCRRRAVRLGHGQRGKNGFVVREATLDIGQCQRAAVDADHDRGGVASKALEQVPWLESAKGVVEIELLRLAHHRSVEHARFVEQLLEGKGGPALQSGGDVGDHAPVERGVDTDDSEQRGTGNTARGSLERQAVDAHYSIADEEALV